MILAVRMYFVEDNGELTAQTQDVADLQVSTTPQGVRIQVIPSTIGKCLVRREKKQTISRLVDQYSYLHSVFF